MKDEFTAKMHADMLGWSQEDTILICVYTAIRKGVPKHEACHKYGISEDYYDENIEQAKERCLICTSEKYSLSLWQYLSLTIFLF